MFVLNVGLCLDTEVIMRWDLDELCDICSCPTFPALHRCSHCLLLVDIYCAVHHVRRAGVMDARRAVTLVAGLALATSEQ